MLQLHKLFSLTLIVFALLQWLPQDAQVFGQDEISNKDQKTIKTFEKHVSEMAKQIKAQKRKPAISSAKKAIAQLKKLVKKPNSAVIAKIKPAYETLKTGYDQMVAAGVKLPALSDLPAAGSPATTDLKGAVSFVKDVAPILNSKCGNCHVNQKRGNFSLVNFNEISTGGGVIQGDPATSRLIEVIEDGEMPKGGGKVSKQELEVLKNWIAAGAKYDGDNRRQSIANLAPAKPMNAPDAAPLKRPKGNETVSFASDIAPILVENCQRCHMVGNPRGNFNMANFRGLLRGGDAGAVIKPGDAKDSHLIQRLRGDGVDVMPPGKKISDDLIAKVVTWINEGASFDGMAARSPTVEVAAIARVEAMSHKELVAERKLNAEKIWKLAMTDVTADQVESDNFLTQGNVSLEKLKEVSAMAETIGKKSKLTKKASDQPFVRGNATIFVFSKRYDFGEFGRMVEKRDFPRTISSTWVRTPERAYVAILMTRNQAAADVQVELQRQLAALFVAGRSADVPRWFADGYGWMQAQAAFPRDEAVKALQQRAEEAASKMKKLDDFVNNRIDADRAALVGYLFVKDLKKKSGSYSKLMADLDKGESFEKSFAKHFKMPVDVMLKRMAESARKYSSK